MGFVCVNNSWVGARISDCYWKLEEVVMAVLVIAHICSNCMCCVVVQYIVQVELL